MTPEIGVFRLATWAGPFSSGLYIGFKYETAFHAFDARSWAAHLNLLSEPWFLLSLASVPRHRQKCLIPSPHPSNTERCPLEKKRKRKEDAARFSLTEEKRRGNVCIHMAREKALDTLLGVSFTMSSTAPWHACRCLRSRPIMPRFCACSPKRLRNTPCGSCPWC